MTSRKLERYNSFIIQHIDNKKKFEEKILSKTFLFLHSLVKMLKFTSIVGYTSCGPMYIESFLTIFGQCINVLNYNIEYSLRSRRIKIIWAQEITGCAREERKKGSEAKKGSACPRDPRKLFPAHYPITWQRCVIC